MGRLRERLATARLTRWVDLMDSRLHGYLDRVIDSQGLLDAVRVAHHRVPTTFTTPLWHQLIQAEAEARLWTD